MELLCTRERLLNGLTIVERAVTLKGAYPILAGIFFEAGERGLRLLATDLDLTLECRLEAEVAQAGSAVLDGRMAGQIVRRLEGDNVSLRQEGRRMVITDGLATFSLPFQLSSDFPQLPPVQDSIVLQADQARLRQVIRQTAFATAQTALEAKPALAGVCCEVDGDHINFIATDAVRLSFSRLPLRSPGKQPAVVILPGLSLLELSRLLSAEDNLLVEMEISSGQALFYIDQITLATRVIDSQFIDYQQVISLQQPASFTAERHRFLAALERISLVAGREQPVLSMELQGGKLRLHASHVDYGEAAEVLSVKQNGADSAVSLDARYLIQMLRAVGSEQIVVELGDSSRPIQVRLQDDDDYKYCVMGVI